MLDFELSFLYEVETRVLNQAVKRNIDRFIIDFMFQLTQNEYDIMKNYIQSILINPSSQNVMMGNLAANRTGKYLPYAFTEQGVAMLSGVLKSSIAINMNISIMRAFVEIRKALLNKIDWKEQLLEIRQRLVEHDVQLNSIYDAMEKLIEEKETQKGFEHRNKIGFNR